MVVRQDKKSPLAKSLQPTNVSGRVRITAHHWRYEGQHTPRLTNLCPCYDTGCQNCPWVDFQDYELCGLTFTRHSPDDTTTHGSAR
ncbi:MAG: hypothetical protein H8D49_06000 [Dehalococcoidia bacterium]|nr:hypothetical protein [Dehalococcoidia bacterium]